MSDKNESYEYHFVMNAEEIEVEWISIELEYNFRKNHNIVTVEVKTKK